jgi:hypothetical protein
METSIAYGWGTVPRTSSLTFFDSSKEGMFSAAV